MYPNILARFRATSILVVFLFVISACGNDPEPAQNGANADETNQSTGNSGQNNNDGGNNDGQNNNDGGNNDGGNNDDQCENLCDAGDTRCASGGVETCVSVDGCPTWADAVDCSGDQVCSGGECTDECSDQCEEGAMECDGSAAFRVCEEQASGCLDWSSSETCPGDQSCDAGMCVGCADGEQQCAADGSAVEECVDGEFTSTMSCPVGCENAECTTDITCEPGDYRCADQVVEVCNATGSAYLYIATCAVDCDGGLCTGECEPGAQRCNGDDVEVCNEAGTAWEFEESCDDTRCDSTVSQCALEELDITSDTELNGTVIVDGPVTVRTGADLYSLEGDLKIVATSITVNENSSITVAATGDNPKGRGANSTDGYFTSGGSGGSHATNGGGSYYGGSTAAFSRDDDILVEVGGRGGSGRSNGQLDASRAGQGGGRLQLIADEITIDGTVRADGEDGSTGTAPYCSERAPGGGGAGGGILVAANDLAFYGTASAAGGAGTTDGCSFDYSGDGGEGVIKFLYGTNFENSGSVIGQSHEGLLAPLNISSTTHPDPELFYNDDFDTIALSWSRPFASLQGYYQKLNDIENFVPSPGNSSAFIDDEVTTYERDDVDDGNNYFHIAAVDAQSTVGEMESRFAVNVNTLAPSLSSSSHGDQSAWYETDDVFMEWTDQRDESNFTGYYYYVDEYGDTVPTADDNYLPLGQKNVLLADQPEGIWAFHIVPIDTMGYLTREASTYVFRIGEDPGNGNFLGTVVDENGDPIEGAQITVNRGLFNTESNHDAVTGSNGAYNFGEVVAGDWELRASAEGYEDEAVDTSVNPGQDKTVDFTLTAQ